MRKIDLKVGTEYAVRANSLYGTLYRATYEGERDIDLNLNRSRGNAAVMVKRLVFRVVAAIDRPASYQPKPGEPLDIENARYVLDAWDVYVTRVEAERKAQEANHAAVTANTAAIKGALRKLGVEGVTPVDGNASLDRCWVRLTGQQIVDATSRVESREVKA